MIKVFLAEDEGVIRDGLRENFPWGEFGFRLVGEAGDGEMALPMIRKEVPDVLITDIKMPFMDGLALSKIVKAEFPKMHIIIISGYDDFDYARQAISVGAEQYLLKPITKSILKKALLELKDKIEQEEENRDYQEQYSDEIREYESFARRHFFEKVFEGKLAVKDIYDESARLSLNITATGYNLIFIYFMDKRKEGENGDSEVFLRKQDELLHYFLRFPCFILFSWNVNSYGVLIKSDERPIGELTKEAVDNVTRICAPLEEEVAWYLAVGGAVERMSMLPDCFRKVNRLMAYRFIYPDRHVFDQSLFGENDTDNTQDSIQAVSPSQVDPERIKGFLAFYGGGGEESEIETFVDNYLKELSDALESKMFRNYVVLNIHFTINAYLENLEVEAEEEDHSREPLLEGDMKKEEIREYFIRRLHHAIRLRDKESKNNSVKILKNAVEYIDAHFAEESLTLNETAGHVGVSTNYLSSIFSRNMQETFVEYLTGKRMEKAKLLLKTTELSSGEIAQQVGYKDPHYFSFVFRKTQNMTPREYRNNKKA